MQRGRWPKPLEHYKIDVDLLIDSAHDEYTTYRTNNAPDANKAVPESLLEVLRLLAILLDELEEDRQKWWASPEKRELRRRLDEECDQKKLSQLHKINNDLAERIETMNAKLGSFVKWSLGMNGGVRELQEGDSVANGSG